MPGREARYPDRHAKDGVVKYFIPDTSSNPKVALAEGVSANAKGDIYAAGQSSSTVHKFVKSRRTIHSVTREENRKRWFVHGVPSLNNPSGRYRLIPL
jgi:hypothetical protein